MFNIDATFEDSHMQANNPTGTVDSLWDVTFYDNFTGDHKQLKLTHQQLTMILAFNLDPNGEPEGFEKFYEELEPLFVGWPNSIRPIP